MSKIRSFPRWVGGVEWAEHTAYIRPGAGRDLRADLIVREPECQDVDCPPVGSMVRTFHGNDVEVVSGPFLERGKPSVTVRFSNGGAFTTIVSSLTLIPETKTFRATYKGKDEADVRQRFGLDGVELEEVRDDD